MAQVSSLLRDRTRACIKATNSPYIISPGTYGIVTSVVAKAYPSINLTASAFTLTTSSLPFPPLPNITFPFPGNLTGNWTGNWTLPLYNLTRPHPLPPTTTFPSVLNDTELFWAGVSTYYRHAPAIVNAGGLGYGYIYPLGNGSFSFSSTATFPGKTPLEATALMQPMYDALNRAGIHLANPRVLVSTPYARGHRATAAAALANTRYRSRLFPRDNWRDDGVWNATMRAIRAAAEAGYTFHHLQYGPSEAVAGWPGRDSGVNPAWRRTAMHAALMDVQPAGLSAAEARARDAKARVYMDALRAVTPGGGSYMNEGDPTEPDWQAAFYGESYDRLLEIKRKWDPWGLFWAPTTVGSEAWAVRTADGYPGSQNGRLCRTNKGDDDDDDGGGGFGFGWGGGWGSDSERTPATD